MPQRLKVLLLAEAANPAWTSVPLVGFNQCAALRARDDLDTHVVTQVRNRDALLAVGWREGEDFTAIDSEALAGPLHRTATALGLGSGRAWSLSTGLASVAYLYFERLVWQRFGERLRAGEFAAVHRITPVSPATPSPLAGHCARLGVPFVLGPINGGLAWPRGYLAERLREGELWSALRGLRRLLPGARRTFRDATRILCGSRAVVRELPRRHHHKAELMPENGIHIDEHPAPASRHRALPLQFAFAGRLVPCKGVALGLEALQPLLHRGAVELTIHGDGPERSLLEQQALQQGTAAHVRFSGWLPQPELMAALRRADVFLFPSIREFGGGALLEAMACGLHPIVVDYGGPPEICGDAGTRIPLGPRHQVVAAIRARAERLVAEPEALDALAAGAHERARTFAWGEKAARYAALYRELAERGARGAAAAAATTAR